MTPVLRFGFPQFLLFHTELTGVIGVTGVTAGMEGMEGIAGMEFEELTELAGVTFFEREEGTAGIRGDGSGEARKEFVFSLYGTQMPVTWHNNGVGFFAFGGFGVRHGFWNSRKQAEFVVHGGVVVEIGLLVGGQVVVDGVQNLVELVGIDEVVVELAKNQLEIVDVIIMILDVRLELGYGRLVRVSLVLLLSFRFAFALLDLAL